MDRPMDEIDIVLSGSSTKYPCHTGFLKALTDKSLRIRRIAANSGGAMVASFFGAGVDIDDLVKMSCDVDVCSFANRGPFAARRLFKKGYLSNGYRFLKFLKRYTGKKKLGDIEIPLYIMVTNFTSRQLRIFTQETDPDILLANVIYMSCSMPGLFKPIEFGGNSYRDGSIHKDFPWDIWKDIPRFRVGHLIELPIRALVCTDWNGFRELSAYNENVAYKNINTSIQNGPKPPDGIIIKSFGLCIPAMRLSVSRDQKVAMLQEGYNNTVTKLESVLSKDISKEEGLS